MRVQDIFCDETACFRTPQEPEAGEPFVLRLWAPREPGLAVSFLCREDAVTRELKASITGKRGRYDVYEAEHPGVRQTMLYFACLKKGAETVIYGRNGIREPENVIPFRVNPDMRVPDWSRGAVWYQIFPDRFCNGDASNDVETGEIFDDVGLVSRKMRWDDPVTPLDVHHFYGGDLKGIADKLDYLKSLGTEVLLLNPVFVSPSSHKYNTQDYEHVDPHLGRITEDARGMDKYRVRTASKANLEASDAILACLIDEAHKRDIRVVLDGVFNHCSSFHAWKNDGGIYPPEKRQADGYYFLKDAQGQPECWWGNKNLLKLNTDGCKELREKIMKIAEKWVSPPYNADGWRLDVAADVGHSAEGNHAFWREFRQRVKAVRPDAVILAEHYGDPSEWLEGGEWDSVMNYDAFMDPVSWFFTGMEKHSDRRLPWMEGAGDVFLRTMEDTMARLPGPSLEAALCQLDNHDHSRFLTRTNHTVGRLGAQGYLAAEEGTDKALLRAAVMLQMSWPGAPGIYYGDEAGLCGFTDPDNRRPYPWGKEDETLIDYYANMIRLRSKYPALRKGSIRLLKGGEGLLIYGRFTEEERLLVVINQKDEAMTVTFDTALLDGKGAANAWRIAETSTDGYNLGCIAVTLPEGLLSLSMKPREADLILLEEQHE